MRHLNKKKFGKGMDHRRKLLRSLGSSIILYEKVETTYQFGKAAKSYVEKAITISKNNTLHARRQLLSKLTVQAAKKALEVLGPKYKDRKGGYTRLTKLTNPHEGKSKVLIELVD